LSSVAFHVAVSCPVLHSMCVVWMQLPPPPATELTIGCTGEAVAKNEISSLLYQAYRTNQETWYTWWSDIAHV
jgi:hypothetical protein